jgi:hypothetical protein
LTFPYTTDCDDACNLVLRPVPGATNWPRRLECEQHGYPAEKRSSLFKNAPVESEKPNDYVTEVASPADLVEIGDTVVSQY